MLVDVKRLGNTGQATPRAALQRLVSCGREVVCCINQLFNHSLLVVLFG